MKACPVCGGYAEVRRSESNSEAEIGMGYAIYTVVCVACGAFGPSKAGFTGEQEACQAWENRVEKKP